MSTLYTELDNHRLPELKPQNEMIEILQREVYGYLPNVGYFKLEMPHFLSRHGWKWFIRFIEKHEE